jgi:hypothetical protein
MTRATERASREVATCPRCVLKLDREAMKRRTRDIETDYPLPEFIEKLRRLANALEKGRPCSVQLAFSRRRFMCR